MVFDIIQEYEEVPAGPIIKDIETQAEDREPSERQRLWPRVY